MTLVWERRQIGGGRSGSGNMRLRDFSLTAPSRILKNLSGNQQYFELHMNSTEFSSHLMTAELFEPAGTNRPLTRTSTGGIGINTTPRMRRRRRRRRDDEISDARAPSPAETAFNEILEPIKKKDLKLGTNAERTKFFDKYSKHLGQRVNGEKNLLHVLAYCNEPSNYYMKSLISKLMKKYPEQYSKLLVDMDETENTSNPLHAAISKGKAKLQVEDALVTALGMKCSDRSENCLHAAIRRNLPVKIILNLIERAREGSLEAQDSKGFTPLHYAVEYKQCTRSRFEVVTKLIECGDSALDKLGNKPDYFSVFGYHESTRRNNISSKKSENSSGK
ncbi:hypothetical protein EAF04_004098 [Stromatinia cepivora]|nr:hypothetical protein EAF04_004098 [Stromatinia cepivora]